MASTMVTLDSRDVVDLGNFKSQDSTCSKRNAMFMLPIDVYISVNLYISGACRFMLDEIESGCSAGGAWAGYATITQYNYYTHIM